MSYIAAGDLHTVATNGLESGRFQGFLQVLPEYVRSGHYGEVWDFFLVVFARSCSRESAVWMLKEWGIRCIVAPSIAEIFSNNCFANAVLPLTLPEATVRELAEEAAPGAPAALFTVDLSANMLTAPSGRTLPISQPEFRRRALLGGLDELAATLQDQDKIDDFLGRARQTWPWAYQFGVPI